MEKELKTLGLSENEIKTYVALLELGSSKVDSITKRINLPRTTIYGLLKSLREKGIVSSVIKGGVNYFNATDPDTLIFMEKEKLKSLKKILPKLNSIKETVGERPTIEMYEGPKGIKSIYDDIIREEKEIHGYGNTGVFYESFGPFVENFIKRRKEKRINFKLITEESNEAIELKSRDKKDLRQTKIHEPFSDSKTVTYIYGDKTAMMTMIKKEHIGVIIKNKEIAKNNNIIFEALWTIAKP